MTRSAMNDAARGLARRLGGRGPTEVATGYRPDLDGLRAIAIGLVLMNHAKWPWANSGGDAGVTAFFVLSGFLITNLLIRERTRHGRIDVLAFYRRRIIRLAPALLGVMAFTLVFGLVFGWGNAHWQLGLVSSVAYMSNWVQYAGINIDPLGHTWTLAIEEQFYMAWPALVILLRGRLLAFAIVGIVAVLVARTGAGGLDYFSTFMRADALLVGCVLALLQPAWTRWFAVAGIASLVAITLLNTGHNVGIPVAIVGTAAIIGGHLAPLGALAPIGLRAYSLYLWNWPMTILFGSFGPIAPVMTVLVGEASFRLLEAPVLHRGPRSQRALVTAEGVAP